MANIVNLKEYLRRVFKDLKEYTDGLSPEELEEFHEKCRNLFKNGEGDYSDRYLLAYYVMEYARAYGFEFSRAYTDILARIRKSKKEVSSVSFGCRTDFADIQNKKECGGNRQWQNHYLRNWAANTKGKGII